jgi:sortase A
VRLVERIAIAAGLVLIAAFAGLRLHRAAMARKDLRAFEEARRAVILPGEPIDTRLWSPQRIAAHERSVRESSGIPLGVLRIPKIRLEAPLEDGVDDLTLDRAVGRIPGTARPGEAGNLGIAGHRDGFFRGLKDLEPGDAVLLETFSGVGRYVVDRITVVDPSDVEVLDPTPAPALTLVTCYPFYFVGSAPRRYVVRAVAAR